MENLTPPAFGWRRGAGGLAAGVVGRVWQGCGQQGGGVLLEGVARAGDRAGGPLLIRQADTAQAGQLGQAVTMGGGVLPCADRGGSFPVLIGAGAGPSRC